MATFDGDHYFAKDVLIVGDPQQRAEILKFLAALLNSKAMRWFYETTFPTLHVQRDELASLPIPQATPARQAEIAALVDKILAAKKSDPGADTSALERAIDNHVFDLYGLAPQERETVRGGGK